MDDIPDLVESLNESFETKPLHLATDTSTFAQPQHEHGKIPITIVTGYLGSGKLTLLKAIGQKSKMRLAIILNEFGDTAAIEKLVTIQDKNDAVEEWLDLGNGCLCCTVKDNGVVAIENLIQKSKDKIDYILLETTGVADPAPIAKMFWLDEALALNVYIDGVVTVVDSANIVKCLDDVGGHWHSANSEGPSVENGTTTAHLQLALADVILLNKADLARDEGIEQRIRAINASLPIYPTSYGDIDIEKILNLHAFEALLEKVMSLVAVATDSSYHDDRIKTVALEFPFFANAQGFDHAEKVLQELLWEEESMEIHRVKGVLVHESDVRVIQGVRETYEIQRGGKLHELIASNKVVFIGKNLDKAALEQRFQSVSRTT